jgi:hypothetical protein
MTANVRKILIILLIACCALLVVWAAAVLHVHLSETVRLPTRSKPNTLQLASRIDDFYPDRVEVTVKFADGNGYVLVISQGVCVGEPQKYDLPDLDNGVGVIHLKMRDSSLGIKYDADIAFFSDLEKIMKHGLLIYFDIQEEGILLHVQSGTWRTTYIYCRKTEAWIVMKNESKLSSEPIGLEPYFPDPSPDWLANEWEPLT